MISLRKLLLGRRLANRESGERKMGAFEGIPAMGLDGLGSSAYGPEAALTVLAVLGAASLSYISWVMVPILVLLAILFASYWQTIRAYPSNGGAYTVARENLGTNAGLLAAAALMIDYVLNVAVGISAGVGALVSAVPALHEHILPICLGILAFVTVMNLRGTLDAGRVFAVPTYLFVASFGAILAIGLFRAVMSGGHPQPVIPPPPLPQASQAVGLWLLLRAFASGCTAMTGVEAVSNGMSAFKEPTVRHGHRTLTGIVVILATLLAGIAYLAHVYGIGAMDQTQPTYRSVLSQLASAVVGQGIFYYVAIASLLAVLALSANTSFVDFPRLCRMVAADGFLPKPFAVAGQRLVFSIGIAYLAVAAGLLLVVFGGITEHLIPLFAIGAFLTFTLSQGGMVVHWLRQLREPMDAAHRRQTRLHLLVNALGAVTTGVALVVIILAKFTEGAWITVLVIPAVIALLRAIRGYYLRLELTVHDPTPLSLEGLSSPIVLVAIDEWNHLADRAITFALTLSPHVIGIHLAELAGPDETYNGKLQQRWERNVAVPARAGGFTPPELVILEAQYRAIHEPVLQLARDLELRHPEKTVAVLVPELVKQRWYQRLLHTHRARRLRQALLKHGGTRLTVISFPWYLHAEDRQLPVVPQEAT
ncbi:MAG: putative aminoacid/polyamine transporter, permease protein [Ramlibacter sp.]|jgi:amino acid transporter|nr:putative aminoacid/polyamine transporter, permease protein [Ramlibacter sp.]MDB5912394.1 putative aminoacid/polyamine transporter, permease protein [Ramlibacter sp.]